MWFLCRSLLLSSLILQGCATTSIDSIPSVQAYQNTANAASGNNEGLEGQLRVMTLNVAHGRGNSFHQLLQRSETTLANLDTIAILLKDSRANVVALQEADGPSFWSGNFNHIDYLADKGGFSQSVRGMHVDGMGLSYGTALIANLNLKDPKAITFDPTISLSAKGFLLATISWPGDPNIDVDIVSVHLDFLSESIRRKQAMELIGILRGRNRPMIIMGDFNTEWRNNSTLQYISQALSLSAYSPKNQELVTFPAFGERLDWILVSPEISFRSHQVIQDPVSDHRGVFAELELDRAAAITSDD